MGVDPDTLSNKKAVPRAPKSRVVVSDSDDDDVDVDELDLTSGPPPPPPTPVAPTEEEEDAIEDAEAVAEEKAADDEDDDYQVGDQSGEEEEEEEEEEDGDEEEEEEAEQSEDDSAAGGDQSEAIGVQQSMAMDADVDMYESDEEDKEEDANVPSPPPPRKITSKKPPTSRPSAKKRKAVVIPPSDDEEDQEEEDVGMDQEPEEDPLESTPPSTPVVQKFPPVKPKSKPKSKAKPKSRSKPSAPVATVDSDAAQYTSVENPMYEGPAAEDEDQIPRVSVGKGWTDADLKLFKPGDIKPTSVKTTKTRLMGKRVYHIGTVQCTLPVGGFPLDHDPSSKHFIDTVLQDNWTHFKVCVPTGPAEWISLLTLPKKKDHPQTYWAPKSGLVKKIERAMCRNATLDGEQRKDFGDKVGNTRLDNERYRRVGNLCFQTVPYSKNQIAALVKAQGADGDGDVGQYQLLVRPLMHWEAWTRAVHSFCSGRNKREAARDASPVSSPQGNKSPVKKRKVVFQTSLAASVDASCAAAAAKGSAADIADIPLPDGGTPDDKTFGDLHNHITSLAGVGSAGVEAAMYGLHRSMTPAKFLEWAMFAGRESHFSSMDQLMEVIKQESDFKPEERMLALIVMQCPTVMNSLLGLLRTSIQLTTHPFHSAPAPDPMIALSAKYEPPLRKRKVPPTSSSKSVRKVATTKRTKGKVPTRRVK
ncbi:MAG: hypothetical protein JKY23_00510 [Nitrospinaceae bacterium]|nr:hypothetical protein [Nitrospinaceae bacterium]